MEMKSKKDNFLQLTKMQKQKQKLIFPCRYSVLNRLNVKYWNKMFQNKYIFKKRRLKSTFLKSEKCSTIIMQQCCRERHAAEPIRAAWPSSPSVGTKSIQRKEEARPRFSKMGLWKLIMIFLGLLLLKIISLCRCLGKKTSLLYMKFYIIFFK